jgi:subtilisin family serine protease
LFWAAYDGRVPKKQARKRTLATVDDGESVVIYIHGIGRHLPKDQLKLEWDLALFGRDRGATTRMAYWSDIVHPETAKSLKAAAAAAAAAAADDNLTADAILAHAGLDPDDARARAFVSSLVRAYGFDETGGTVGPHKKVLPLPGFIREPVSRVFLKQFIADTAAYFFDEKKRVAIRKRLIDVLPGPGRPVTLVAHSQGSIVAVEVLAEVPKITIAKLVTIGSPLGLQEVQDFLEVQPRHKPFYVPSCIERWDNFADPLDPVALDKGLAAEFTIAPGTHTGVRLVTPITDQIIVNGRTFRLRGFNPHSAAGYLSHPKVRHSVYETTHFDAMARFVMARDVAEALGRDERHPVLIEVLEPGYAAVDESAEDAAARDAKAGPSLAARIERAALDLEQLVKKAARDAGASAQMAATSVDAAKIDRLRRFVAAHLTPAELRLVAKDYRQFNVYAVWRSASKKKLLDRSRGVLQADAALESYRASGARVKWAVLDTGVRSDHPHFRYGRPLKSRIAAIWDCTRRGRPVFIKDDDDLDGHGSHVAGIITGTSSDGGKTYSGLAPDAEIVVYKVLNARGEGEDAWIIKALDHIAEQNENNATLSIHGINLSLGGPYDSTVYGCGFTPICQELRRLWRSGVLVVVACGNEGQLEVQTRDGDVELNTPMSIGDPANLEDCVAVGSVNADRPHLYGISSFSSRGPTSDGRVKPDVVAPGERITSVNARFSGDKRLHRVESGTSMAAPHVSGLLAAFLSVRREFIGRPDEVKKILLDTCTDIGRDRQHQGRGIPNLMKMLLSV